MKAPFPYFGGKSAVSDAVWSALGQPEHYLEPFFGSGAVLLGRRGFDPQSHTETVCDADGHVANVWRSLQSDPDEVAKWCDWPVNHADLMARKKRLNEKTGWLLENLAADDGFCEPKLAGYWIWAASCWIGHGLIRPGVHAMGKRPHLADDGKGVQAKGQIPRIGNDGEGVHAKGQRPHLGDAGRGVQEPYNENIYAWFRNLSERLRNVRVVCGDWSRICGGDWQDSNWNTVGVFFDPPYGHAANRDTRLYSTDSLDVADAVRAWCLKRGDRKSHRIVLAGYREEHQELLQHGWTVREWSAGGGYANVGNGEAKENRHREALFMSPHCVQEKQADLFEAEKCLSR